MTVARRALGPGPQAPLPAPARTAPHRKGAVEADLDAELPAIQLPDLGDFRSRGVLGAPGRREQ
ncbi:hypothetical protein [Streptomyces sp. RTd22]|uniref:hypothetical protein n=1 Tax=Streptomyces sp. RTd22 TaxID=1841249 RepID=UPI0018FF0EDB|nr:hypothetical protein [Streptomyces sp. RTd22]